VIKLKKEWRKVRKRARGKTENLGIETKKDGFQDGGMGEVDAGFAEIRNRSSSRRR
jgi:hypothetical protein